MCRRKIRQSNDVAPSGSPSVAKGNVQFEVVEGVVMEGMANIQRRRQYDLAWFHPNFEGEHLGAGQGLPPLFPFPQPHKRAASSTAILEYPYAVKALFYLKTSLPPPGFEPRPYGTAVSVANHYTGWVVCNSY
ncbi:hypothetical protein TNCV_5016451 [Trichonephila clavipes]|nr:hypothetical protein TNCV_5016451 [Trichonephila clavipes]